MGSNGDYCAFTKAVVRALPSWFRKDQPARAAIQDVTVAVA